MTSSSTDSKQTCTLTNNATGESYELPVLDGSIGPKVIDVIQDRKKSK